MWLFRIMTHAWLCSNTVLKRSLFRSLSKRSGGDIGGIWNPVTFKMIKFQLKMSHLVFQKYFIFFHPFIAYSLNSYRAISYCFSILFEFMLIFTAPGKDNRKIKRMRRKVERRKRHRMQDWNRIENMTEKSTSMNRGIFKLAKY